MMTHFLRISATALAALMLLALAACDSPVEPTSVPTLKAQATVATLVVPMPTSQPRPTISPSAATNTPSPSPTEQPGGTVPGPCGELCNSEFWHGEVNIEYVRAEVERGADVNARHSSGNTPLLWAVVNFGVTPEVIRLLLDHGADADAKDARGTPILSYALVNGRSSEVIRWLLESGADANARNGDTPLLQEAVWFAAHATHPEMVRLGSEDGRDLPMKSVEIIESLLEHGAVASGQDGFGNPVLFVYFGTIIEAESYNPDRRVVELLLEHGAEVEATLEDYPGASVMGFALWAGAGAEIIALMLEHGADATARGEKGDTLLHAAALFTADPQVFRLLLDNGADVAARGALDRTVLHLAARVDELDPQAIRVLLDGGADVSARDEKGATPLHHAATHSGPEAVRLLLERGADASARDERMKTPLHKAITDDYGEYIADLEKVQLLLAYGADAAAADNDGTTACDLAHQDDEEVRGVALLKRVAIQAAGIPGREESGEGTRMPVSKNKRIRKLRRRRKANLDKAATAFGGCGYPTGSTDHPNRLRQASRRTWNCRNM